MALYTYAEGTKNVAAICSTNIAQELIPFLITKKGRKKGQEFFKRNSYDECYTTSLSNNMTWHMNY